MNAWTEGGGLDACGPCSSEVASAIMALLVWTSASSRHAGRLMQRTAVHIEHEMNRLLDSGSE